MCPENEWILALVGSIHFAGFAVGCTLFGILADKCVENELANIKYYLIQTCPIVV